MTRGSDASGGEGALRPLISSYLTVAARPAGRRRKGNWNGKWHLRRRWNGNANWRANRNGKRNDKAKEKEDGEEYGPGSAAANAAVKVKGSGDVAHDDGGAAKGGSYAKRAYGRGYDAVKGRFLHTHSHNRRTPPHTHQGQHNRPGSATAAWSMARLAGASDTPFDPFGIKGMSPCLHVRCRAGSGHFHDVIAPCLAAQFHRALPREVTIGQHPILRAPEADHAIHAKPPFIARTIVKAAARRTALQL